MAAITLSITRGSQGGVALIGFAVDEGVRRNAGRVGAAHGPDVARKALANLAWCGQRPVYDSGDIACQGTDLEGAQHAYAQRVALLLQRAAQHIKGVTGGKIGAQSG